MNRQLTLFGFNDTDNDTDNVELIPATTDEIAEFQRCQFNGTLGAIDRDAYRKNIIDLVTNCLFNWEKPWRPFRNGGCFVKVNGKVVHGVINAYNRKPYMRGSNVVGLCFYTDFFNKTYGTDYSPILVPSALVAKMKWQLIPRKYELTNQKGKIIDTSGTIIDEFFWVKVTDESELKRLQQRFDRDGYVTFPYKRLDNGDFLRMTYKSENVTLAQNLVGNPLNIEKVENVTESQNIEYVDNVIKAFSNRIAPVFDDKVDECYYSPKKDEIHLVPIAGFASPNEYYSTRFHESTHSTLHKKRLNRDFGSQKWGDAGYAEEELVAEINAYLMCAELGITYYRKDKATPFIKSKENSMAYLASWVKVAQERYDNDAEKAIFDAFTHAEKAFDYMLKDIDIDSLIPAEIKAQSDADAVEIVGFENDKVKVVHIRRDERVRIFFKELPTAEQKEFMKTTGIKWANSFKAWQAKDDEKGFSKINKFLKRYYNGSFAATEQPAAPKPADDKAKRLRLMKMKALALASNALDGVIPYDLH